jgi:1-deoxy-D-xylulose 5-phosphate reductoisomerase
VRAALPIRPVDGKEDHVDSATMANKGLEIFEAQGCSGSTLEDKVVIHRKALCIPHPHEDGALYANSPGLHEAPHLKALSYPCLEGRF